MNKETEEGLVRFTDATTNCLEDHREIIDSHQIALEKMLTIIERQGNEIKDLKQKNETIGMRYGYA